MNELKGDLPEGFKMTELGPLPEEWEVVRLGDVADFVMGQSPPGSTYNEVGEGLPFLQGKAEFGLLHPRHIKYTTKPIKIASKNSVLLSVRAPVGDVNIANIDYCIGRGLASVSLSEGNNLFLFYILSYLKSEIEKEGTGSTFKAITKIKLMNILIPLPPLPEQEKIAAILSAVQEAKEKTEAVISAAKILKKSMMSYLFTYGPVPVVDAEKVPLKETEVGMIPEEWEVENFEGCILRKRITIGNVKQQQYKQAGKYPIVDQGQKLIAGYWDDEIDVYKGELPVIIFGDHTRIIKFIDFPFVTGADGTKILLPNTKKVYPLFFYYALLTLKIPSRGYNRHYSLLKTFKIPLPPLPTQQKIASMLSAIDEKFEAEENKKKALEDLFKTLLHNLMTAKIRVNSLEVGV